jgi:hypothetical protein
LGETLAARTGCLAQKILRKKFKKPCFFILNLAYYAENWRHGQIWETRQSPLAFNKNPESYGFPRAGLRPGFLCFAGTFSNKAQKASFTQVCEKMRKLLIIMAKQKSCTKNC